MTVPAGTTAALDAAVGADTVYNYTVRAVVSAEGCETEDSACVSALTIDSTAPPPVPDGGAGSPLVVGKGLTALRLDLSWDAPSCPAEGYHLLHGPLGHVSGYEIAGARCGLGTSGTFAWIGVPADDVWFLVVGASAGQVEGDWGARSDGEPRGGGAVSGRCGMLVRDDGGSCTDEGPRAARPD
jgi:hypothetical protein